ncbi:MAG TPA: excinuclease ABC subunit UvrC, partial [Patescibacteria group bacterium]|nr:excinuclease ABC subunit UvrC [Patescibacteria group bacterium]
MSLQEELSSLPKRPGVYLFKNKKGKVIYVGKAKSLFDRVHSYFQKTLSLGPKTSALVSNITSLSSIEVSSEVEALLLEANLIKKYVPKYNVDLKDGKSYPLVRISLQEDYPRISIERKKKNDGSYYLGPFTDTSGIKTILRMLRAVFPYRSCRTLPPKPCLYYHLGLCVAPCTFTTTEQKKEYRTLVRRLTRFLHGDVSGITQVLLHEMKSDAKALKFEEAAIIKRRVEQIQRLTRPFMSPDDYLKNPNLLVDIRERELEGIAEILRPTYLDILPPTRIECFDISNIQGTDATGSMVVFTKGEADKNQYKRFKIRTKQEPNDVAMMREVISRRLKHDEWAFPDLICVDGGRAQLTAALVTLQKSQISIPVISLAKRDEEIYIPGKLFPVKLSRRDPALQLIQ